MNPRINAGESAGALASPWRVRPEWIIGGLATAWVVGHQLLQWPAWLYPIFVSNSNIDSAFFAFAGELLRKGGSPYLAYWDHKPPLVHLINAAALTVSNGQVWGVWCASLGALLSALLLAYHTLRQAFGMPGLILGLTFFALSLSAVLASNLTEEYVLPIQWAAVLVFVRWNRTEDKSYWTGCLLGAFGALQFLLRPNLIGAVLSVTVVLTVVTLSQRKRQTWGLLMAGLLSGALLIGAACLGYLALNGSLSAFLDQVFRYNMVYSAASWKLRIRAALSGLKGASVYGAVLPFAGWLLAIYKVRQFRRTDPCYPLYLLSIVWLPIELLFACLSGREYAHYFIPLLPALSLLTAVLAAELIPASLKSSKGPDFAPLRIVIACAIAMAILPVADMLITMRDRGLPKGRMDQITPTIQYIREHSEPQASILVWGHAADVYFFSNRKPASHYIYPLPLLTPGYVNSQMVQGFLDEVRAAAPALIVDATMTSNIYEDLVPSLTVWDGDWRYPDPRREQYAHWRAPSWWTMTPALKAFYDYVSQHYAESAKIGPRGWVVYQRRTLSEAPIAGSVETRQ